MTRRKAEDFICLRTYEIPHGCELHDEIINGKLGRARAVFFNDHLTEAQRGWIKTMRHWYIHIDNDWGQLPTLQLSVKRREMEFDPDNMLLGLLLFS